MEREREIESRNELITTARPPRNEWTQLFQPHSRDVAVRPADHIATRRPPSRPTLPTHPPTHPPPLLPLGLRRHCSTLRLLVLPKVISSGCERLATSSVLTAITI